jgi:hypothetical protein
VFRAFSDGRAAGELPGRSREFFVRRFPAEDTPGTHAWLPASNLKVAGPTWLDPSDKIRLSRVEEPPVRDSALLNHSVTFSRKDGCEAFKTFAREVDGSDDEGRARAVVEPLSGTPPSAGGRFFGRTRALRLTLLSLSLHVRPGASCAFGVSAELRADWVRSKAGVSVASRFWSTPAIRSPGATPGVVAELQTAFVVLELHFGSNFGLARRNAEINTVKQITVMNAHSSSMSIWTVHMARAISKP